MTGAGVEPQVDPQVELQVELHGVILHVVNLERAVDFYSQLLDLRVAEQTSDTVFLTSQGATSTIVLSERRAEHFTDRTVQALVWRTPTLVALGEVEQRLDALRAASSETNESQRTG